MSANSPIEWTDATWNPIGGCTRVSEGCRNCYAEVMAARFSGPGQWGEGLARIVRGADGKAIDHRWSGQMRLNERALDLPLRWKKPRRIFVNSTSDLFHENLPDEWIDKVFAVMALAPRHTFQVLTKRPERAREYLQHMERCFHASPEAFQLAWGEAGLDIAGYGASDFIMDRSWPLPNVWLGTSIEDQAAANARVPHLLETPAAVRFVSAEPLLGRVILPGLIPMASPGNCISIDGDWWHTPGSCPNCRPSLDWVIVGGESGHGARPMHPDWARSLRDQCAAADVAFFMKQMGGHPNKRGTFDDIPADLQIREVPHA